MKITVSKKDLMDTLGVVSTSLGSSDISGHYVFRFVKKGLYELLSNNSRVFSSCPLPYKKAEGDPQIFTIEGKRLKNWLGVISDDADITIQYAEGTSTLTASTSKGKARFQSFDPTNFPFWDKTLEEVEVTASVEAGRLISLLGFARDFISSEEAKSPQICVAEIKNGVLYSTNKMAACIISVHDVDKSNLRVHGSDASSVLSFLSTFGEKDIVEICEHDRMMVLKRADGAVFGETRFKTAFPDIGMDKDHQDQHFWVVNKDDLLRAIDFLTPSAAKDDFRLGMERIGDEIRVSMLAMTGDEVYLDIPCKEFGNDADAPELKRFHVAYPPLKKVIAHASEPDLHLGINRHPQKETSGWVSYRELRHDYDRYLLILVWLRR